MRQPEITLGRRLYFLSVLSVLSVSAPRAARAQVKNPDTFVEAQVGEVTSLDPAIPYVNSSQNLIFNVYETLISYDGPSLKTFVPVLATQVPSRANGLVSQDGRTYRFPIRKGVHFHDGSLMTPEDVRYSLLRFMLTDEAGGPSALLLDPILGVSSTRDSSGKISLDFKKAEAAVRVEGDSIVIRLPRPFAPFLSIMARWSYVESLSWAAAHGEWDGTAGTWQKYNDPEPERSYFNAHMNGTGPFELERWDRMNRYVLLKRFDGYWRKPAALKEVLVKTVPEFGTRKLMLVAGDADAIETPVTFIPELQGLPGVRLLDRLKRLETDPVLFFTFKINAVANPDIGSGKLDGSGIPPDFFTDADLRKGFAYAFNYPAFLKEAMGGAAEPAIGPIPPDIPGYDPQAPHYTYDRQKAAEYFKKAWGGQVWEKGFRFTVSYNVGSAARQLAGEVLKREVEALNPKFHIELRGLDWGSFLDKGQRHLMPIFCRGWFADYPDAHNFVYAFYDSTGRYPSAQGYSNPKMDTLIEEAAVARMQASRQALYGQISRIAFEDEPSIVTVHAYGAVALRKWVRGFYDNPVFLGLYYYPLYKSIGVRGEGTGVRQDEHRDQ